MFNKNMLLGKPLVAYYHTAFNSRNEDSRNEDSRNEDSRNEDSRNEDSRNEDSRNEDSRNEDSRDSRIDILDYMSIIIIYLLLKLYVWHSSE